PTDVQPVFETNVKDAARLCAATDASLYQREADVMRCVANYGRVASASVGETRPITRGTGSGRAILDCRTIHLPDVLVDVAEFPDVEAAIRREGIRAVLSVPLLREGLPIGAITVRRTEARPYSDKQIRLIETFADQAVIAIENVRLFNETKEALERQTATAEILRVISSSPTDIQPVLDAVAENAAHICTAADAHIRLIEGASLRAVARFGSAPLGVPDVIPLNSDFPAGRSIIERRTIHVEDFGALPETEYPTVNRGTRSILATPLVREGVALGAIVVRRIERQAFTERQIELMKTFADQAVIAIENVRLFNETKEALEQQTATSGILRVIASS